MARQAESGRPACLSRGYEGISSCNDCIRRRISWALRSKTSAGCLDSAAGTVRRRRLSWSSSLPPKRPPSSPKACSATLIRRSARSRSSLVITPADSGRLIAMRGSMARVQGRGTRSATGRSCHAGRRQRWLVASIHRLLVVYSVRHGHRLMHGHVVLASSLQRRIHDYEGHLGGCQLALEHGDPTAAPSLPSGPPPQVCRST